MSNLFDNLLNIDSPEILDTFIGNNIQDIFDFCNSDYKSIKLYYDSVDVFISFKTDLIEQLDYSKGYNKAFVAILLELCERLNLRSSIIRIHPILTGNNLNIGSRLYAILLYMCDIDSNTTQVERFDKICQNLENAILFEDDDDKKAIATFLNYYGNVINNTKPHIQFAERIKTKLTNAVENANYHFLQNESITELLTIDLQQTDAYEQIQQIIDRVLNKKSFIDITIRDESDFLIEKDTDYSKELSTIPADFDSIRNISVRQYRSFDKIERDRLFYELKRCVEVILDFNLMYTYLYSVGNMHKAKLQSAFEVSQFDNFSSKVNILDWGCGQGIASMIFIEKYGADIVNNITLIEPSEIAIKRAALHIKKYNPAISIKTICKKLDDLTEQDIKKSTTDTTIHLFSNILDIDDYKQSHLIDLIEATLSNINYFVCASPYIDDVKTEKLESFKRYFENKYNYFELLLDIQNSKTTNDSYWNCNSNYKNCKCLEHPNCGCGNQWTRVIKVFKIE